MKEGRRAFLKRKQYEQGSLGRRESDELRTLAFPKRRAGIQSDVSSENSTGASHRK